MHAPQTAQLQQQQTADLQRIWDQRELERTQAEAKRGAELLQQQEAASKAAEEEARAAQAKAADQQAKTDALLQAVLLHLQESKLATTRTPRLEAPSPIPATTTATSSSSVPTTESSAELQWNTHPCSHLNGFNTNWTSALGHLTRCSTGAAGTLRSSWKHSTTCDSAHLALMTCRTGNNWTWPLTQPTQTSILCTYQYSST